MTVLKIAVAAPVIGAVSLGTVTVPIDLFELERTEAIRFELALTKGMRLDPAFRIKPSRHEHDGPGETLDFNVASSAYVAFMNS